MFIKNVFKGATIVTLLLTVSMAFAQQQQMPPKTPEQRAENQTRRMEKVLALNKEQYKKVYSINLYYAREINNANMEPQAGGNASKKELRHDKDGELRQVLTADQYEKYVAFKEDMKARAKERRGAMQN